MHLLRQCDIIIEYYKGEKAYQIDDIMIVYLLTNDLCQNPRPGPGTAGIRFEQLLLHSWMCKAKPRQAMYYFLGWSVALSLILWSANDEKFPNSRSLNCLRRQDWPWWLARSSLEFRSTSMLTVFRIWLEASSPSCVSENSDFDKLIWVWCAWDGLVVLVSRAGVKAGLSASGRWPVEGSFLDSNLLRSHLYPGGKVGKQAAMIPNCTSKLALVSLENFYLEFELTVSKTSYQYHHLKPQSVVNSLLSWNRAHSWRLTTEWLENWSLSELDSMSRC